MGMRWNERRPEPLEPRECCGVFSVAWVGWRAVVVVVAVSGWGIWRLVSAWLGLETVVQIVDGFLSWFFFLVSE